VCLLCILYAPVPAVYYRYIVSHWYIDAGHKALCPVSACTKLWWPFGRSHFLAWGFLRVSETPSVTTGNEHSLGTGNPATEGALSEDPRSGRVARAPTAVAATGVPFSKQWATGTEIDQEMNLPPNALGTNWLPKYCPSRGCERSAGKLGGGRGGGAREPDRRVAIVRSKGARRGKIRHPAARRQLMVGMRLARALPPMLLALASPLQAGEPHDWVAPRTNPLKNLPALPTVHHSYGNCQVGSAPAPNVPCPFPVDSTNEMQLDYARITHAWSVEIALGGDCCPGGM
jgi:hypothetical protein